jgi:hypothetical protein
LAASAPLAFDAKELIEKMYAQILSNWNNRRQQSPSKENWRFELCTNIADGNKSPEVKLERAIASIIKLPATGRTRYLPHRGF